MGLLLLAETGGSALGVQVPAGKGLGSLKGLLEGGATSQHPRLRATL